MNILQVIGVMNRGGAEVMLMDILRHLPDDVHFDFLIQLGRDNRIVTGEFDQEILDRGCRIFHISPQWKGGGLPYLRKFKQLIFNEIGVPDVIHSHINRQGGMVALAAHRCGIKKIIVHSHGCRQYSNFDISPRGIESKVQRFLIKRYGTDFWGCSKEAAISLFSSNNSRGNYTVINNALNFELFQNITNIQTKQFQHQYNIKSDEIKIGYIANFTEIKNHLFLLKVLKSLESKKYNTHLYLVGRTVDKQYFEKIISQIKQYELQKNVTILGEQNNIPLCLSSFDVFLGGSIQEGFGMVVTEAQAAGLPCIISPGYPHSVDLGLGLIHFMDNYDPEKWADKILQINGQKITDKKKIYTAVVQSGFDAAENTKRIIELYKK